MRHKETQTICIDYIPCSWWFEWGYASKYSSSHLHKPLLFFPSSCTHACLSLALYSPAFSVVLYLTRGEMNAVHQRVGKWNQPPPPQGVTASEYVNGQTLHMLQFFKSSI